jgi:DNA-binding CsgD family transcriptional regulator
MAPLSKTQQALALMQSEGISASEAARRAGIKAGTVLSAVMRMKGKELCPCCGQVVREGFEIDRSVLKDTSAE